MIPKEAKLESCQLWKTFAGSMQKAGNFRRQIAPSGTHVKFHHAGPSEEGHVYGVEASFESDKQSLKHGRQTGRTDLSGDSAVGAA
eukprot:207489-Pelagomonas_calceolata.AAC.3